MVAQTRRRIAILALDQAVQPCLRAMMTPGLVWAIPGIT
jgi:hypothetical protein